VKKDYLCPHIELFGYQTIDRAGPRANLTT
jgi:hypothetical protein